MTSILPMNFCVYPTLQYSDISWFTAPMSSNTLRKKESDDSELSIWPREKQSKVISQQREEL